MSELETEIYELKIKLQVACQTINDQQQLLFQFQKDFSSLMSPEDRQTLWSQTQERLQQLERELALSQSSEQKAAGYNRFLIEKLIKMTRGVNDG